MKPFAFAGLVFPPLFSALRMTEAADLQVAKAPPFVSPPFSWTGFYIGGNVGAGFAQPKHRSMLGLPSQPSRGLRWPPRLHLCRKRLMAS